MWDKIKEQLVADTEGLSMGDVTDFSRFMGAVIDDRAFAKHRKAIARVRANKHLTLLAGGQTDDSVGYFVRPTIVVSTDPSDQIFSEEYFGPSWPCTSTRTTGSRRSSTRWSRSRRTRSPARSSPRTAPRSPVPAPRCASRPATSTSTTSRPVPSWASSPSAVAARGTNDKAGAAVNLLRWTSPRAIKETFVAPTDHRYPYTG